MSASPDERPTFSTYWRKNKEASPSKSLTFVQSDPSQSSSKASGKTTEESEQSAKTKRRAQVRKAQIQHRARKADYTKQLEADIESIRAQIDSADRARHALRSENDVLRAQLGSGRQQHHHHHELTTTTSAVPNGFYTAAAAAPPTSYPQEAGVMVFHHHQQQQQGGYGGFNIPGGAAGLDAGCFGGLGGPADLSEFEFLGSGASSGGYYDDSGSPAYASSSRGSSGGLYGSPQYLGSGSHTPFLLSEMGPHGHMGQGPGMDYMAGF